jgi:transposase-like protein
MEEMKPLSWSKLGAHFNDEDKAREYMEFLRWGNNGPACPHCGGADPYRLTPKAGSKTRKGVLKCKVCRKQFTVTVGTVFEDSHIKMTKWIQAIYLIGASKKGISAHQLHRMLGVTYRAAWFMAHRLRYACLSVGYRRVGPKPPSVPSPTTRSEVLGMAGSGDRGRPIQDARACVRGSH